MDRLSTVSVICEYNPFHFGHKYQIDKLKETFRGVVCIISGDIVQRGSVAAADKYLRAEAALKSGADLVLEHPVPFCCSSARDFASSGVHIASAIGTDSLAFGAEDGEEMLFNIYSLVKRADFDEKVKALVEKSKNISYPQALVQLVAESLGEPAAEAVKKPNNILALEYLKALEHTNLSPFFVKREPGFRSSSQIRAEVDAEAMLSLLPPESRSVFTRESGIRFPRDQKRLDSFFIGTLRRAGYESADASELYSCPQDLRKKILQSAVKCSSVDELVAACTDKGYTGARVRRAINAIVFGITPKAVCKKPPYTTVLAANDIGREILRTAKRRAEIDIVNKPVRALSLGEETKNAFLFAKSIEDVIAISDPTPSPADIGRNPLIGEPL